MGNIFETLITRPFAWVLLQLYNLTGSYGVAIILFGILVKLILFPFSIKGKRGNVDIQKLQPKIKELEKKYGKDKEKYSAAVQKLYEEENVKPMSGCLWTLIPFPILICLYQVIRQPLTYLYNLTSEQIQKVVEFFGKTYEATNTYLELEVAPLIHEKWAEVSTLLGKSDLLDIDFHFLGLNLGETPSITSISLIIIIPIISAITGFISTKVTMYLQNKLSGVEPDKSQNNIVMTLMMPAISLWFGFIMPAGMSVYWIIQNILGIGQEFILHKYFLKVLAKEAEEARIKEEKRRKKEELRKAEIQKRKQEEAKSHTKKCKVKKNLDELKPTNNAEDSEENI